MDIDLISYRGNLIPDIDPSEPGDWQNAFESVQGGLLKHHGRDHVILLCLRFGAQPVTPPQIRRALSRIRVGTALDQLKQARLNREAAKAAPAEVNPMDRNSVLVSTFLSATGLKRLGIGSNPFSAEIDENGRFWSGMAASGTDLGDKPKDQWEPFYREDVHALVQIASDDANACASRANAMTEALNVELPGFFTFHREVGAAIRAPGAGPDASERFEHFGFRDNVSDPIFFQTDLNKYTTSNTARGGPVGDFDPAALPSLILVRDPLCGPQQTGYGSFVVFRKLAQDVPGFLKAEADVAGELKSSDPTLTEEGSRDLASAYMVGRFKNGTPVVKSRVQLPETPDNSFRYPEDSEHKCPFHAHIRKTNLRGSVPRVLNSSWARIARRGITYGPKFSDDAPDHPRGVLFLCCNRNVSIQFERIQSMWANSISFPNPVGTGPDAVIGQSGSGLSSAAQATRTTFPSVWGGARVQGPTGRVTVNPTMSLASFVELKGGEYFYAPSPAYFNNFR